MLESEEAAKEEAEADTPSTDKPLLTSPWIWGLALILLAAIAYPGTILVRELLGNENDNLNENSNAIIGYVGVHPNLSFARPPDPWIQRDGKNFKLWGGWKSGAGHSRFLIDADTMRNYHLTDPSGRDGHPAIDFPLIESGGGIIWDRIPDQAEVIGERLANVDTVYPLLILEKVLLINDQINDHPFLITFSRFLEKEKAVSVFDPVVDGKRLTFGNAGYVENKSPVLYDRGTESLWTADAAGLKAISGVHKGTVLKIVSKPRPVNWGDWKYEHPATRLVVGSDRSRPRPLL